MNTTTWPQTGTCEGCDSEFTRNRPNHRFCGDDECKRRRTKERWEEWRERREADGTYRDKMNQYQRAFRERTGYHRDYELRTKYGITLDAWLAMVEAVGGKCEICGKDEEAMCVDHCHDTGRIRGVLCRACNRALGQLGDTVDRLRKALLYLERSTE